MDAEIKQCHQAYLDSESSFNDFLHHTLMDTTASSPQNTTTITSPATTHDEANTTPPATPIHPNALPTLPYEPLNLSISSTADTTPDPPSTPPQPFTPTNNPTHSPSTSTPPQPTTQTTTTFDKLVELNHAKNKHQHHINILQKHISKQTSPNGLTIHLTPRVHLSPKHQNAWNTSIQKCMSQLTTILHQHHMEELAKINDHISSISSNLHNNHSPEISNTIIHLASRKKQHTKHKPPTKRHTKSSTTQITTPSSQPPTKRHKAHHHHTAQTNFHHGPHRQKQKYTHAIPVTKPTLPLRPPHTKPVSVQHTLPHPPIITASTIQQQLVGKQKQFPTIYKMFMKGRP